MFRLERIPQNLRDILLTMMDASQASLWTALPCIVQSVNYAQKTCVVQPAIQAMLTNQDGSRTWVNLPVMSDVPLVFPSGGGFTLTFPVAKGDEALVVFSSRCIDAWWQSGAYNSSNGQTVPQKQALLRMHDLSDGFAIVGLSSLPNVPASISQNSAQLRNLAGTVHVEVKNDGSINLVNAATSLTLGADGSINPFSWVGLIAPFAMGTVPPGWLACPTTATTASRTTYARLFAAIGTTWGAGDGSTTFGIPYFAAGYVPVAGTPGALSHGVVKNHTHNYAMLALIQTATPGGQNLYSGTTTLTTQNPNSPEGGADNLAAGMGVQWCVKY